MLAADKPVGGKECPMEHFHGLFDAAKYLSKTSASRQTMGTSSNHGESDFSLVC